MSNRRTIFFDNTGPLVQYDGELLYVEDLNPQVETKWRMSRWEMIRFGFKAILAGILHDGPVK